MQCVQGKKKTIFAAAVTTTGSYDAAAERDALTQSSVADRKHQRFMIFPSWTFWSTLVQLWLPRKLFG